jgi:hypothetical protein
MVVIEDLGTGVVEGTVLITDSGYRLLTDFATGLLAMACPTGRRGDAQS